MQHYETDVIVIGCGVAGMTAALSALESGASTINIERSTFEERGGNSRWTEANLMIKTNQEELELMDWFWELYSMNTGFNVEPDFIKEMASDYENWHPNAKTAPILDPELLQTFGDNVVPTLEWLKNYGIRVNTNDHVFPSFVPVMSFSQISGGGLAVIESLTPAIEEKGGKFLCETTAIALLQDDMGRVCGVKATGKNNEPVEIKGKAVILASGGFEGNPQMLAQYLGGKSRHMKPVAKGGYYNKGEGLKMALDLNAAPAGDWSDCHRQMVDPRSPQPEALVDIWPCGILVNQWGQRFMDECPDNFMLHQEEPGKAMCDQPNGLGYMIFDDALASSDDQSWKKGLRTDQPPHKADTLEELALQLQIPPQQLVATVANYNAACTRSDEVDYAEYDPTTFNFGGKSTQGLNPPKSNYAKRIEQGPFYCYPIMPSICFTYGGLKVTPDAQVLNYSGEIIPGLYAAGETVGVTYRIYTGATSVLRGLTFGRLAGNHAAQQ